MLKSNQAFEVSLEPQGIKEIEKFTDIVCDSLYINDTYYGNILMALTNAYELCMETRSGQSIKLSYNTDYQAVTINIQPFDLELLSSFEDKIDLTKTVDEDRLSKVFLIQSLSDNVSVDEQSLKIQFDISAMHNAIYEERMKHLSSYLAKPEQKVSQKENDTFQ